MFARKRRPPDKLSAISIDVDSLRFYREIHGLPEGPDGQDPIYEIAMPRFFDLLESLRIPATLFLVGRDAPEYARAFERVESTGSEIANHTHAHDYRLTTRPLEDMRRDLERAEDALVPINLGRPLAGFRAPGYNVNARLLEVVVERGYQYDSSLLPAPSYFAARAAAIAGHRALGRSSRSMIGEPRQFAGPLEPYRTDSITPWKPVEGPLVELPMLVEPTTRAPLIGTTWVLAPPTVQDFLLRRITRKLDFINFEMHAIDLLDQSDAPELEQLAVYQRDLRVPADEKITAFKKLFGTLSSTSRVVTLAEMASVVH